jgi:flagellar motor switch protein FliN/FliY
MATDDTPNGKPEDDGMADWAEALQEQQSSESKAAEVEPGSVLSGNETPRPFSTGDASDGFSGDISRVLDIPVQLSVELGRTRVPIKHILKLGQGSVVELDALAGEPMDVLVNGYLIAQGEVVVVNEKFGIRLTDVVTPSERLRRVSKS